MIVSASRRTDLPAFYADWFFERLRRGFCQVANPYNPRQVSRVSLRPGDVAAFVFWSKNPEPMLDRLDLLEAGGHVYYFLYTLNDYPPLLEPGVPPVAERLITFERLADRLGPARVVWRYDPIVLGGPCTADAHRRCFERLVGRLAGASERVIVSALDFYRKTERRLAALENERSRFVRDPWRDGTLRSLLADLAAMAAARGLQMQACAQPQDLRPLGIAPARCIDPELLARLGRPVPQRKDRGQRPACGCAPSRDIGAPDTCLHGCRYCYATRSPELARRRHAAHRPNAPLLWPPAGAPQSDPLSQASPPWPGNVKAAGDVDPP